MQGNTNLYTQRWTHQYIVILEQHVLCPYAFSPLSRRKLLFYIGTIIFAIIFVFVFVFVFAIIFVFTTRDFI